MKKWNLVIDVEKCEDCNNCFLACKDEHVDNDWPGYTQPQPLHGHRWINIHRKERGQYPLIDVAYLPKPCMHCDNAPCMNAAKDGAVYRREDGIVMINPQKAKGAKDIHKVCPYNAVWWNEQNDAPQKCTFCAHLLDNGWNEPRCVQACPTGALQAIHAEDSEMKRIVESDRLEVLSPEYNTNPHVYYKNLYRFNRCFIRGSVAFEQEGLIECAEGANITLTENAKKNDETSTDGFGDFIFDNLQEHSGKYTLEIFLEGYEEQVIQVELEESLNVGNILLKKLGDIYESGQISFYW